MASQIKLISLTENSSKGLAPKDIGFNLSDKDKKQLRKYSGTPIQDLLEKEPELLVFPKDLNEYGEKWSKDSYLFHYDEGKDGKIGTKHFVGFFGIGSLHFQIQSKFDEDNPKQFFLYSMLQRILHVYMLNMPTHSDSEPIWDILFFLFPDYLKRALRQGIFRTYRTFERNDDHVRGTIDILRNLRLNTPFSGKIIYRAREYSGNNYLTHLIRHTIEVLQNNPLASGLLTANEEIRTAVRTIIELTPDFSRCDLSKVIAKNLRPLCHPYYTEYSGLQSLCLKILRHERITYGQTRDRISGVVFRADNLWERYLAEVLAEADCGIRHGEPNSTDPSKAIPIYQNQKAPGWITPDFFTEKVVMDAKYKDISTDNPSHITTKMEDRAQLITYLHIHQADAGFLICPSNKVKKTQILYEYGGSGILNGGGIIGIILFAIPEKATSFADFQNEIRKSEEDLISIVRDQVKKTRPVPATTGKTD